MLQKKHGMHFESYLAHASARKAGYPKLPKSRNDHSVSQEANSLLYQAALGHVAPHRKFFTTKKGTIGLGSLSMLPGDQVCKLSGGRVPFILGGEGSGVRLVGESRSVSQ